MWIKVTDGGWRQVRFTDAPGFDQGYQVFFKVTDGRWYLNSWIFETKDCGIYAQLYESGSTGDDYWALVLPPPGEAQPANIDGGQRFDATFTRPQRAIPLGISDVLEHLRGLPVTWGIFRIIPGGIVARVWFPAGTSNPAARATIVGAMPAGWVLQLATI